MSEATAAAHGQPDEDGPPVILITQDDGGERWLECDHGADPGSPVITALEPGMSWDDLAEAVRAHLAAHGYGSAAAQRASGQAVARWCGVHRPHPGHNWTSLDDETFRCGAADETFGSTACGHEFDLGGVAYACERAPHAVDGHLRIYRHAAAIDAGLAERTDEGDGCGPATLVTWGEDGQGDRQDWEIAWGSIAEWQAGLTPAGMSAPARAARAAALSHRGGNRLGNNEGWNAAAQAAIDASPELAEARAVVAEMIPLAQAPASQLAKWRKRAGLRA